MGTTSQAAEKLYKESSTAVADPQGMKLPDANATANSPTCHLREADANLLN
jgi:hypothetical protein